MTKEKPKFVEEYVKKGAYLYCCSADVTYGYADLKKNEYYIIPLNQIFQSAYQYSWHNPNCKLVPGLDNSLHVYVLEYPTIYDKNALCQIQFPPTRRFVGEYLIHAGMLKTVEML